MKTSNRITSVDANHGQHSHGLSCRRDGSKWGSEDTKSLCVYTEPSEVWKVPTNDDTVMRLSTVGQKSLAVLDVRSPMNMVPVLLHLNKLNVQTVAKTNIPKEQWTLQSH